MGGHEEYGLLKCVGALLGVWDDTPAACLWFSLWGLWVVVWVVALAAHGGCCHGGGGGLRVWVLCENCRVDASNFLALFICFECAFVLSDACCVCCVLLGHTVDALAA